MIKQANPKSQISRNWKAWTIGISVLFIICLYAFCLPDELFKAPRSTVLLDNKSELLGATIATDGQWRFPSPDSLPNKFKECLVEFEDRKFYSHPGVHLPSFVRAAQQNIKAGRVVSGGSTITMQVIRLSRKGKGRTVFEKLLEVVLATRLEFRHSKEDILKLWAANAPFGGNVVGLEAAAWRYYDRSPHDLSWSECATLAVLPNAPALIYPGRNQEALLAKRNRLLDRLLEKGVIDVVSAELAKEEDLPGKPHPLLQLAPHLLQRAIAEGRLGTRIRSTLDKGMQVQTARLLADHVLHLKANEIHNAAAMVIDIVDGDVLAYIGNAPLAKGQHGEHVDVINAPRSTGSILKPLLYASMLDDGELLPNTLIPDIPTNIAGFSPKNFNMKYDGAVPASEALARSLNIPAVHMLREHGLEKFHFTLQSAGLSHINQPAGHYGLTLVLGGAESSLWDIANAYTYMSITLENFTANGGQYALAPSESQHIHYLPVESTNPKKSAPLFSAAAIHLTYKALLGVNRPESETGWEQMASSSRVAWKTGTSFGHRDAWAIGTTAKYLVAVWVGNANGEGRPGNTGVSNAAPLMFKIFDALPNSAWFDIPYDELVEVAVCRQSGHRFSNACLEADTILSTAAGLRSSPCPYHKLIHVDRISGLRTSSDHTDIAQIDNTSWFVLPPAMEWFYKTAHPEYKKLPPFSPNMNVSEHAQSPMAIVQPNNLQQVKIPKELNGKKGALVFEVAHREHNTSVFWHLDEQFLGETKEIHQMSVSPELGPHVLTLMDSEGFELVERFVVLE